MLVAFGDKIAFEDTLNGALDSLFGGNSGASAGDGSAIDVPSKPGTPSTPSTSNADKLKQALQAARNAMIAKDSAMAKGDWTAYGKADAALKAALEAALAASNN